MRVGICWGCRIDGKLVWWVSMLRLPGIDSGTRSLILDGVTDKFFWDNIIVFSWIPDVLLVGYGLW